MIPELVEAFSDVGGGRCRFSTHPRLAGPPTIITSSPSSFFISLYILDAQLLVPRGSGPAVEARGRLKQKSDLSIPNLSIFSLF